ncbi:amidase domain-containing protein [Clostridium formicaceticum]|uniref:Amidase domain-containing protein n=1 Tax=Clostridium formicaceticum TaxID=1497 RepID=A0ABN4TDK2_9CLOT|nr:amidase domain-containing protein [Clostridium formicaceticum]
MRFKRVTVFLLAMVFLSFGGLGIYFLHLSTKTSAAFIDEDLKGMLTIEVQQLFDLRNQALLEKDTDMLANLYATEVRYGLWAYEHELKKMNYLHNWSDKQSIVFKEINSQVIVRSAKNKQEGFSLSLLVSTEYQYVYEDAVKTYNSFRLGTYHVLDLMPDDKRWCITREWYTDPFADSLDLDELKSQEIQQQILSGEPKNLSDLNERRVKAVAYADQYCGAASLPEYSFQYNPKYRNYNPQGGDCANFASQMLYEGGNFRKNSTWNYERGAGSKAWINANAFNNYMLYSGRASLIASGTYEKVLAASHKLLPGDYVAYEKKGKVTHISVVTGIDSKGYALVNSHNSDRYRVPWDLGWSNKGIKFRLVRVHY